MGQLVRAGVYKHLYIRVVQGHAPIGKYIPQSKVKLILAIILQKYLIHFNYVTVNLHYVCIHPSMLSVCACMYAFVKCVCIHLYMCSSQPEVAAILDWYGPEADPAYWRRGREEVAGLQVYSM